MTKPLVSILMSVHNGESTVGESIDSILAQTFGDWELILVDDGSSDGSLAVLRRYAAQDGRIRVIESETNRGLPAALNLAAGKSVGRYLARQDADDISLPDRLQRQVETMAANPDVAALGTMGYFIDTDGDTLNPIVVNGLSIGGHILQQRSVFPHGSMILRSEVFREVGGYDERFWFSQDMELVARLHARGHMVATLVDPLYLFRTGQTGSDSFKGRMQNRFARCMYAMHYDRKDMGAELEALAADITARRSGLGAEREPSSGASEYWLGCAYRAALGKRPATIMKCLVRAGGISWKTIPVILYYLIGKWPKSVPAENGMVVFKR